MLTTVPPEDLRRGSAACTRASGATTLTSRTARSAEASSFSSGGKGVGPRSDALLTRMCKPPSLWAASTRRARCFESATSPAMGSACPPRSLISAAAAASSAGPLAVITTAKPWPARNLESVRPSPRPAPVTSATLGLPPACFASIIGSPLPWLDEELARVGAGDHAVRRLYIGVEHAAEHVVLHRAGLPVPFGDLADRAVVLNNLEGTLLGLARLGHVALFV